MLVSPDNPVWQALSSHQQHFNAGGHILKYFPQQVSPFAGLQYWDERDLPALLEQLPADRTFSVMIAQPVTLPEALEIVFSCQLYQMECHVEYALPDRHPHIQQLGESDIPQMLALTGKTKPGPFLERTIDMGHYFGIYENGQLVSMAGERLRLPGYTEISAICTDPAHLGRGFASLLTEHVAQHIFASGSTPFLHVKTDNTRAIEVYQRTGFDVRTEVYFAIFRKKDNG